MAHAHSHQLPRLAKGKTSSPRENRENLTKSGRFTLYDKLSVSTIESTRYTEIEVERLAKEFADFQLNRTMKVKDV
jgi:hypothetical protein